MNHTKFSNEKILKQIKFSKGLKVTFFICSGMFFFFSFISSFSFFMFIVYGILGVIFFKREKSLTSKLNNDNVQNHNESNNIESNEISSDNLELTDDTTLIHNSNLSTEDIYIKSFENLLDYDFNKSIDDEFLANFKLPKNKLVEYDKFMKYTNTTKRPDTFVVFDFETTGLNNESNEIIQISAIKFEYGKPTRTFNTYVKPNKKIPSKITNLTGISNEDVSNAPSIEEVLPNFLLFIEDYTLVAHNAPFDMSFLLHNLYKYNYKKPKNKVIDTLKLSRSKIREYDVEKDKDVKLSNYKLSTLKDAFMLYDLSSHDALEDCKVCAYVYLQIINTDDYVVVY